MAKAIHAMIEGNAEGIILRFIPPRTDSKDEPTSTDFVNSMCHLSQDCWIAEGITDDQRSQFHALGGF